MKPIPCLVCSFKYDEDKRCPLLLQCGHGFCRTCLSEYFKKSPDSSLPCPLCRNPTPVGNSVASLTKNFAILDADDIYEGVKAAVEVVKEQTDCFVDGCLRVVVKLHKELTLVKNIGGRRVGVDTWEAVLGRRKKCRHELVVKKVVVGDDMLDFMAIDRKLEELRNKTMWCKSVCAFHGVKELEDGSLGLVMDRYVGSVRTEIEKNNTGLTLDQILRYGVDITRGVSELHAAGIVCRTCLSEYFKKSPDSSLPCPLCRNPTPVGNSVASLTKNFAILDADDIYEGVKAAVEVVKEQTDCFVDGCLRVVVKLHKELTLVKNIGGRRVGVDTWEAVLGRRKKCRHELVVKKVVVGDDMLVFMAIDRKLEELRNKTMWCKSVCAFHGVKELEDGSLGLVMDRYVGSVRTEIEKNNTGLTLDQILRYGVDITRGVSELHAAGIVCMNINPSNILLDENDHAAVCDYGLPEILKTHPCQKARPGTASSKKHSCMDCTMLIPTYTAPEAWLSVTKKNVVVDEGIGLTPMSDSWSFGCTLLEMCTGKPPWVGLDAEKICKYVVKDKKQPPQYTHSLGTGIPTDLWKMIGDCLQIKEWRRPTFPKMLAIFLKQLQVSSNPLELTDSVVGDELESQSSGPPSLESVSSGELEQEGSPSLLHRLVSEGNVDGVREFLASNLGNLQSLLEAYNTDGQTALHLACRRGSLELVRAILQYKEANVDILSRDGDPPLVTAVASLSHECVHGLIRRGANVAYKMRRKTEPSIAHVCAYHGQPQCMQEVLVGGGDPNAVDTGGESVLHRAISRKSTECAIIILEKGGCTSMGVINTSHKTPLHLCVETWNVAVIKKWVEFASTEEIAAAIEIPSPLGTALCMAAFLKKGHEPEGREIVKILLAAGANPEAEDTQINSRTALHTAAMINDIALAQIIMDAGVDVNIRNKHNTIPLHIALARGSNAFVQFLLSAGANYNVQDNQGHNALHIAAYTAKLTRENLEWLEVMLRNPDAAVGIRNNRDNTLQDFLEAMPREWISEELTEALSERGIHLSPTKYKVGDWVKFKRGTTDPAYGWQGVSEKSVGFVLSIPDEDHLNVSFCTGFNGEETRVLANEVVKVIALVKGHNVRLRPDVQESRFGWRRSEDNRSGRVLSVEKDDGTLRIGFSESSEPVFADPAEMERVQDFHVGDWVSIPRIHPPSEIRRSIGIVSSITPANSLMVDLNYLRYPFKIQPEKAFHVEPFKVGDSVCIKHSVKEPRYSWGGEDHYSVGKISEIEIDGLVVLCMPHRPTPWEVDPADLERVRNFKVGEWVGIKCDEDYYPRYGWDDVPRISVGIIHSLDEDGDAWVAYCFRVTPFQCSVLDLVPATPFQIGQEIKIGLFVTQPQLGWSNETADSVGKIERIDMDATLKVKVSGRRNLWNVSPADAIRVPEFGVGDWVRAPPVRSSHDNTIIWKECLAVVHSIHDTGILELASCSRAGRFNVHYDRVKNVPNFKSEQHVRFREGLTEPRWGWRGTENNSLGVLAGVQRSGVVTVKFFGLEGLLTVDPDDLEVQNTFEVGDWVKMAENATPWESISPGGIGIVQGHGYHEIDKDVVVLVAFCGEYLQWAGKSSDLEGVNKFLAGQRVRVKDTVQDPRFGWAGYNHESVVTISTIDGDGKLRIRTKPDGLNWMLDPSEVEVVEEDEFRSFDWVRVSPSVSQPTHYWGDVSPSSIGVVFRVEENGDLCVLFCFLDKLWLCKGSEMEKVRAFRIGDQVKIREGVVTPRWGWAMETHASRGEVVSVNGDCEVGIRFQRRRGTPFRADPADIVLCESSSSSGIASIAEIVPAT